MSLHATREQSHILVVPQKVLWGGVEEDLLSKGKDADTHGGNSGNQMDHVLALVLVILLNTQHKFSRCDFLFDKLTCFQDPEGVPSSSMLGRVQLATALPLLGTTIRRELESRERATDMMIR